MMMAEKIAYYQRRARQERETAAKAQCAEARLVHLALAQEHERAAERETARLATMRVTRAS